MGFDNMKMPSFSTFSHKLQYKIEDIRLTAKAKYLLMIYENKTEEQAHKYIERQAMNQRRQKKEIAKEIIDYYDKQNEI